MDSVATVADYDKDTRKWMVKETSGGGKSKTPSKEKKTSSKDKSTPSSKEKDGGKKSGSSTSGSKVKKSKKKDDKPVEFTLQVELAVKAIANAPLGTGAPLVSDTDRIE